MNIASRRVGALAGAVVVAAGLVVVPSLSATAAPKFHPRHSASHAPAKPAPAVVGHVNAAGNFVGYAVNKPVCKAPKPGQFSCMAVRQVPAAASAPGAYRYSIPAGFQGPGGGYTPRVLQTAYGYNPHGSRSVTVGIVDAHSNPSIRGNLAQFDKQYGLHPETSKSFRIVNEHGGKHNMPHANKRWGTEIALDVEAVRGVCHFCKILLVLAKKSSGNHLATAENTAVRKGADVVSNSFGSSEISYDKHLTKWIHAFQHPKVVTTVSSADNGYNFWDLRNGDPFGSGLPHHASFPSTLPKVVSVGGTSLHIDATGHRTSETVWNTNGPADRYGLQANQALGAEGGGCSFIFKAPKWQRKAPGYKQSHCNGKRLAVDVSALGDPNTGYDVYDKYGQNGWGPVGGTSLSSPIMAGLYGLAGGKPKETSAGHALYSNKKFRHNSVFDVVRGGNGWCGGTSTTYCSKQAKKVGSRNPNRLYAAKVDCSYPMGNIKKVPRKKSPECNAQKGYDGATGIGVPHSIKAMTTTLPLVHITISTPRKAGKKLKFKAHVMKSLAGSKIKVRKWSFGDGTKHKKGFKVHHTFKHKGHFKIRVTVKDNRHQHVTITKKIHVHGH